MKTILIEQSEKDSLKKVIEYLRDSEFNHYEESEYEENHIYTHIKQLYLLYDKLKLA